MFKQDLPNVSLDGWEVTVSEIDMPPGRVGQAHRYPEFVLAYVLEGEIRAKISDQPETTYKAGQMFMNGRAARIESLQTQAILSRQAAGDDSREKGSPQVMPAQNTRFTEKESATTRATGVSDREAGLRTRFIYWLMKRRLGRISLGARTRERDPKLLELAARMDNHTAVSSTMPADLKELAQIKVAVMVGCPF
jgi:hypothetical protein